MEIKEAQKKVDERIQELGGYWQPLSMLARLGEEFGELSRAVNIKHGDKKKKSESDGREIKEEMANLLFTAFALALANRLGVDLEEELLDKLKIKEMRDKEIYNAK